MRLAEEGVMATTGRLSGRRHPGTQSLHGNELYGDALSLDRKAIGGNDVLWGGFFQNTLFGDASELSDRAHGGNDILALPRGVVANLNTFYGDAFAMFE